MLLYLIFYHTIRSCGTLLANNNISLHSILATHLPTTSKWSKQKFSEKHCKDTSHWDKLLSRKWGVTHW